MTAQALKERVVCLNRTVTLPGCRDAVCATCLKQNQNRRNFFFFFFNYWKLGFNINYVVSSNNGQGCKIFLPTLPEETKSPVSWDASRHLDLQQDPHLGTTGQYWMPLWHSESWTPVNSDFFLVGGWVNVVKGWHRDPYKGSNLQHH